ncbi:hypothetical protein Mcate_02812 [Meiothermus taiwanensis]|uniref:Uncharacterized protein n=1 Tax=Meiothermus taiwanensis TaxID=172827 RepID=A0A399DSW4_9DEIN|nr:hypothetical protein Mcate_02812 [Meiothermus taiwanensis]
MMGTSRLMNWAWARMGATRAVTPRMKRIFRVLEPTTLPMAMAGLPERAAARLAASSGLLVPKATTVRPTTMVLMPQLRASITAFLTSDSPPKYSSTTPLAISNKFNANSMPSMVAKIRCLRITFQELGFLPR